jgi:hypothetical protein
MNKAISILSLLFILGSCKKNLIPEEEIINRNDYPDAMAVTELTYLYDSANTVYFNLEIVAMKNDSIFTTYPDSTFRFTTGFPFNTSITPLNIQRYEIGNNLLYQTVILIDETNPEWIKEDYGYFINSLVKTIKATNELSGNYFALGFYSRNTLGTNLNVKYIEDHPGQPFVHDKNEFIKKTGDYFPELKSENTSSLYDALNDAADLLIANPLSINQSITIFTTNLDDGASSATVNSIIQKCKNNNIKINIVNQFLFTYAFYELVFETGGFIMDNDQQAYSINDGRRAYTTMYFLDEILKQNGKRYSVKCKAVKSSPWSTGVAFNGFIKAFIDMEIPNPYFWDNLNNDLYIDQYLPVYFKVE